MFRGKSQLFFRESIKKYPNKQVISPIETEEEYLFLFVCKIYIFVQLYKIIILSLNPFKGGTKMKTVKQILSIIIVISMMILSACSDSITSSLNSLPEEKQTPETGGNLTKVSYSSSFKLKPNEHIMLNSVVTSLKSINEYSISNCFNTRSDLYISASNIGILRSLPCESNEFLLDDIMIENISGTVKKITVKLTGVSVDIK